MGLAGLYIDGKGQCNVLSCDHCLDLIDNDEYLEAIALHQVTREASIGRCIVPIWMLHGKCCTPFIVKHATQGDRWLMTPLEEIQKKQITWTGVAMDTLREESKA